MKYIAFVISAALLTFIVWRIFQCCRTGELELNGRILHWSGNRIERVVFVIAIGAHLLLVWIAVAGIAYCIRAR